MPLTHRYFAHCQAWLITLAMAMLLVTACNYPPPRDVTGGPPSVDLGATLQALASQRAPDSGLLTPATGAAPPDATPEPGQNPGHLPPPNPSPAPVAFAGLHTATPGQSGTVPTPAPSPAGGWAPVIYLAQSGDTLASLAARFEVDPEGITSLEAIPDNGLLRPGLPLQIPSPVGPTRFPSAVLPDSEVLYSPTIAEFDIDAYVDRAAGFLSTYHERVGSDRLSGSEIVARVAVETSVNPRLLLAFLEYRSGWVLAGADPPRSTGYPIGFYAPDQSGLYNELTLTANHLNLAFYDWRVGTNTHLRFKNRTFARLSPALNAGSVAVQHLLAEFYDPGPWMAALYGPEGLLALHQRMFGDPWSRAATVEPLLAPGLAQPSLELPFTPGERWIFTGGPHRALTRSSPIGAVDFAPAIGEAPCAVSRAWALAAAPGVVTRSGEGVLALDLDGDGHESTGWVLYYFHIADFERAPAGAHLAQDEPLGHPSCEGGRTTGSHVHLARKYNGEWLAADGALPMVLSGWQVQAGERLYMGFLRKGDRAIQASPGGSGTSIIIR